ncbi:MAG: L,D-transpeptidase family protein [Pseudomonadota bacterium]
MTPLVVSGRRARLGGWSAPCAVGRGGIGPKAAEGDGITPQGRWRVVHVFYRPDRVPPPCPKARPIGLREAWCDDPQDPRYNQLMPQGQASPERLRRADPLYDLIGVLDYNMDPVRADAGSAIFLHAWRKPGHPTAGCVAFAPHDLAFVLGRLGLGGQVVIR